MISSTCCYLIRNGRWLMLLRNRKKNDINGGKWIGVGGKTEEGETSLQCAVREIREETGYEAVPVYRGNVHFVYDTKDEEMIDIYTVTEFSGQQSECAEGTLAWIPEDEVMDLNLWEGDRIFMKKLLEKNTDPFSLELFYDDRGNLIHAEERGQEHE